jgi:predicted ATP-grasp superfamily ATP-dependent carboligase
MVIKENTNTETSGDTSKKTKKDVSIKKYADLEGKFLIVKVGSQENPATQNDINDVQNTLINLLEANGINCLILVSGFDIDMKIVDKQPELE